MVVAIGAALIVGILLGAVPAFADAGDLDRSFHKDGRVTTDLGGYDNVLDLALQPDGKLVAVGYSGGSGLHRPVVRYDRNGALDRTFGGGDGKVVPDFGGSARAVAVQPDGKIVVAGGARGFALARFNSDGTPDMTFGENGTVKTDSTAVDGDGEYSGQDYANDLVVQPDAKIVVAGQLADEFALARYTPDGTLDTTFGKEEKGLVITDFGDDYNAPDWVGSLALQPDGRILAAGVDDRGDDWNAVLARYTPDGTLDTTFSTDGLVITGLVRQGGPVLPSCSPTVRLSSRAVRVATSCLSATPRMGPSTLASEVGMGW